MSERGSGSGARELAVLLILLLPGGVLFLMGIRALAGAAGSGLTPVVAVLLGSWLIAAGGWYHHRTDHREKGRRGTAAFFATTAATALIALVVTRLLFR
jgi:MFS family permease